MVPLIALHLTGVPTIKTTGKATTLPSTFDAKMLLCQMQVPTAPVTVAGENEAEILKPRDVKQMMAIAEFICPLYRIPQRLKTKPRNFRRAWECVTIPSQVTFADWLSRKHALQDLAPYICLFEKYSAAEITYGSLEDWSAHNEAEHALHILKLSAV